MKIQGMKGLHEICKARSAGLTMPDKTSVGDDVKIILSVNPKTIKRDLRDALAQLGVNWKECFSEAKIVLQRDLK